MKKKATPRDSGSLPINSQKKYLSYLVVTWYQQEKVKEWHTVEVIEDGTKVRNKNGVTIGIAPFLKLRHFYHDELTSNYPK